MAQKDQRSRKNSVETGNEAESKVVYYQFKHAFNFMSIFIVMIRNGLHT